ncbi:serine protease [Rhizobium ruizarguesonis]|uniref:S1 family peptidase n=1 Tax=Rhizobium ruizarguesonis TaxID=2081791 RepID=UPI001032055F|nr:serine protease [Rhizobium ruizarguesonis]TAW00048.1 serine protease [Rhizobium ruizarguesonis]TAW17381.1 serine protease [Rhizobium ruizarguesonis]TAZ52907.1 serine protease [Rhizobium ruizarguesonis]
MRTLAALLLILISSGATDVALAQNADTGLNDRVRLSTVYLKASGRTTTGVPRENVATGFFINDRGNILTVNHLISDLGDVDPESIKIEARVGSKNANMLTATIYDARPNRDLLLLDVDDTDAGPALCVNPNFAPQKLGNVLYTVGFPKVLPILIEEGKIISNGGPNGSWITNMAFAGGQSGSPVYDANGIVIGLAKGQLSSEGQPVPGLYVILPIGDAGGLVPSWRREAECTVSNRSQTVAGPLEDEIKLCVAASLQDTVEKWVVTGGARAEGSGPSLEPQHDKRDVCYPSPPNFAILGPVEKVDRGNNGGRGSISEVEYITTGDRPTKACVTVAAWGSPGPFGAGGWQNVELSGKIIEVPTDVYRAELEARCRTSISAAISPPAVQE